MRLYRTFLLFGFIVSVSFSREFFARGEEFPGCLFLMLAIVIAYSLIDSDKKETT